MRRSSLRLYISLVFILAATLMSWGYAQAADQKPSGITVSPALTQVDIHANETEHPLEFRITNNRPTAQSLRLSSADFNALEDTGGLLFVGSNPTELQKKYGLAKWLSLPAETISVAPGQTANVRLTILNQPNLTPGGHYGALMITLDSGQSAGRSNQVALNPIASALIFVNKVGGDIHKLSLDKVEFGHNIFQAPSKVGLRFRNNGNTHVLPRGTITVTDAKGKLIKKGLINQDSNIILPEHSRLFVINLKQVNTAYLPSKYKLDVNYRFDGYDNFRTYQKSFLFLTPPGFVLFVIAILILGYIVYRFSLWKKIITASRATLKRKNQK